MGDSGTIKFVPRNATAARISGYVVGNPVTTRLESGVGNCYPGLEFDIRNLERRFFPFLEVDFVDDVPGNTIQIVSVDPSVFPVPSQDLNQAYQSIAADMGDPTVVWTIDKLTGDFGPFGQQTVVIAELDGTTPGNDRVRRPPDPWTAVRLLRPGSDIEVHAVRRRHGSPEIKSDVSLKGTRRDYLDANGAFDPALFEPGELTQSLCSPWTHDFRDCACYYWASNHPDIAQPPVFPPVPPFDPKAVAVPWMRSGRGTTERPSPAARRSGDRDREMDYYEINARWQELDFVVEGRETRGPYTRTAEIAVPLTTPEELERYLRYAAGVELAVIQEYLAAAYSLNTGVAAGTLLDDVTAARAEIMRVAFSEMRHLRAANDILRALHQEQTLTGPFRPALQVASKVPKLGGGYRPVTPAPLSPQVLQEFVAIEAPSASVDGVYGRIFATLERDSRTYLQQIVRSIMEEGVDHYDTFSAISEWLSPSRHDPNAYLLQLAAPAPTDPDYGELQTRYRTLLETLRRWFAVGLPAGQADSLTARGEMLGAIGLEGTCERLQKKGVLITFAAIADPDFTPIDPPNA